MGAVAHPPTREVALANGRKVVVRPWNMATRRRLRPKVADLLDKIAGLGTLDSFLAKDLVTLFLEAEDEIVDVVRESIPIEDLSEEVWDNEVCWGADATALAMAVWDLNFASPTTGVLGKAGAGLATLLGTIPPTGSETKASPSPTPKTTTTSKRAASVSSLDVGGQTQSA